MYEKTSTEKKLFKKKKLFPSVVGTNNILINYPEHDKNHYIHHKKKLILKKSLSKKFKQKRANANLHKSQTKLISCFIIKIYCFPINVYFLSVKKRGGVAKQKQT